ncbi:lipopolysaccharide assembly protein LapA domain-containing protein [Rhodococcus qingshengii]|uniref:lipopolysaccharide assembly protein LapA domain-containing protein n=1 Tax=Rhodococcus qingshengii TaxID=334542 RepID=UPI001AE08D10
MRPENSSATKKAPIGKIVFIIIPAFALCAILAIFSIQNIGEVRIDFLGWNLDTHLGTALLLSAACGFLISSILSLIIRFRPRE